MNFLWQDFGELTRYTEQGSYLFIENSSGDQRKISLRAYAPTIPRIKNKLNELIGKPVQVRTSKNTNDWDENVWFSDVSLADTDVPTSGSDKEVETLESLQKKLAEREVELAVVLQTLAEKEQYIADHKHLLETSSPEWYLGQDESITHEFKSSFQTPATIPIPTVIQDGKQKYLLDQKPFDSVKQIKVELQTQCLKAIVGFLNSRGGNLVVGVKEKGGIKEVVGIERELDYDNDDRYLLNFHEQINNRIGSTLASEFITTKILAFEDNKILVVEVREYRPIEGGQPALLDGEHCYHRTGPRTDEIRGIPEILRFANERIRKTGE